MNWVVIVKYHAGVFASSQLTLPNAVLLPNAISCLADKQKIPTLKKWWKKLRKSWGVIQLTPVKVFVRKRKIGVSVVSLLGMWDYRVARNE
jgi:hypothetical protein